MVNKKSEGKQVNEIFLNDLPKYSDWAKYILGIKQLEKKLKKQLMRLFVNMNLKSGESFFLC